METQPKLPLQEQQSPWDALDLDDSDISTSTTSSISLLRRCSNQQQQPPSRHLIPGPASSIQAAMHRKDRINNINNGHELSEVSTQEYIRRVEQDSNEEFSRHPWTFALDFLRHNQGMVDSTPLKDVKKCVNAQRIDQVVAIVKSCTSNGLGDLIITLKDPTDTIGASIHRKALVVEEFGKLVTMDSVLILKKVVAFPSSISSCYLNITRRNLVTVISVDGKAHNYPDTNVENTQAIRRNSDTAERTTAIVSTPAERNFEDIQQNYNRKRKADIERLMGKENTTQAINLSSSRQTQNAANVIPDERVHIDLADPGALDSYCRRQSDNPCRPIHLDNDTVQSTARILEDLRNGETLSQATGTSSAPSITENMGYEHTRQRTGAEIERLFRTNNTASLTTDKIKFPVNARTDISSSMPETVNGPDIQKQRHHLGISSAPSMMGNLVSGRMSEPDDTQKRFPASDTVNGDDQDIAGANGSKKQRVALMSVTSVQEWTDEQLSILDMDEE